MTNLVRSFLAFEVPADVRQSLADLQERFRHELPRARWILPERQHVTLKFLGESPRSVLSELVADLAPRLALLQPVRVTLAGTGIFPSRARPRIAWLGGIADGVEPVIEVIEESAERRGFPRERRRFSLHITQARLKGRWPEGAVERFLDRGREIELEAFVAREVVLFESVLEPTGAVYTPLERMPLD